MFSFNKKDKLEVAEWFVNLTGIFCHYEFFTKELWRKVDGFEIVDNAEVLVAFQHYWFHHNGVMHIDEQRPRLEYPRYYRQYQHHLQSNLYQ